MTMYVVLLMLVLLNKCECLCVTNFLTTCESVSDLEFADATWTDLIIENKQPPGNETLNSSSFSRTPNLEVVYVVGMFGLEPHAFRPLEQLSRLKLHGNKLTIISSFFFSGLRRLTKLNLQNNQIRNIRVDAFVNSSISDINLSNNLISLIKKNTFEINNLKKLGISYNKLQNLEQHAFPNSLVDLDLSNNELQVVNIKAFELLTNLKRLNLSNNKLQIIVPTPFLKSLQTLYLSFNNISIIENNSFDGHQLVNLYLNDNFLKFLSPTVFGKTVEISTLHLHNNLLSWLPGEFEALLSKLRRLTLAGNPWSCSCLQEIKHQLLLLAINLEECDDRYFSMGQSPICFVGSNVCEGYTVVKDIPDGWLTFRRNNKCKY